MAYFSSSRNRIVFIVGLLCIVVLGGMLLSNGLNKQTSQFGLQISKDIDTSVSNAIKFRRTAYGPGETATEGHIILGTEDVNRATKVYTIVSYAAFGFENGIFTIVSGSGAIPTVITLSKNEHGEYSLLDYKEPTDGAGYTDSLKKMFPSKYRKQVLSADKYYQELSKQQEAQAAEYLKSIGRTAQVSAAHVPRKLPTINVQASNKLFAEQNKSNPLLNNCPFWLGTREQIENGVRYIYETSQSKTSDGYDLITFRKTKEDGTVVEEEKYKIVGSEPQRILSVAQKLVLPNGKIVTEFDAVPTRWADLNVQLLTMTVSESRPVEDATGVASEVVSQKQVNLSLGSGTGSCKRNTLSS